MAKKSWLDLLKNRGRTPNQKTRKIPDWMSSSGTWKAKGWNATPTKSWKQIAETSNQTDIRNRVYSGHGVNTRANYIGTDNIGGTSRNIRGREVPYLSPTHGVSRSSQLNPPRIKGTSGSSVDPRDKGVGGKTEEEKRQEAITNSSPASQFLKADYDYIQRLNALKQQALLEDADWERVSIEDLAESERIKQQLALYGAGVGTSGLGSQLSQKTSIRRYGSLAQFQRAFQRKQQEIEINKQAEEQRFFQKLSSDASFWDNLVKSPFGQKNKDIVLNSTSLKTLMKTWPNLSREDLETKFLKDGIARSVKDRKKQDELLEKYTPFVKDLLAPLYAKGGKNITLLFDFKSGTAKYHNPNTGEISIVKVEGNKLTTQQGLDAKSVLNALSFMEKRGSRELQDYIKDDDGQDWLDVKDALKNRPNVLSDYLAKYLPHQTFLDYSKGRLSQEQVAKINNWYKSFVSDIVSSNSLKNELINGLSQYIKGRS